MSIDLPKIPERLREAAKTGNLVPFIGAGVSRQAKTIDKPLPTWTELISELIDTGVRRDFIKAKEGSEIAKLARKGKYLMAAQALKSAFDKGEFPDFLHRRFSPKDAEPGVIHERLFELRPPLILTTNYDMLLEEGYFRVFKKYPNAKTFEDAPEVEQYLRSHGHWEDLPLIFKIHGDARRPATLVFTEEDYRKLRYVEHGYRTVLSAIFVTNVVLMLGFSFSDPEITVLTESLRESLERRNDADYIVLPKGEKGAIERKRLRDDFGLHVIEYKPSENHRELLELVDYLVGFVPPRGDSATAR